MNYFPPLSMQRARGFLFVWYNPEGHIAFLPNIMNYLVYQKEEKYGVQYYVGYVSYVNRRSIKAVWRAFGGLAHVSICYNLGFAKQFIMDNQSVIEGPYECGMPPVKTIDF